VEEDFVGSNDLRLQAQVYVTKQVAHMAFDMIDVTIFVKHEGISSKVPLDGGSETAKYAVGLAVRKVAVVWTVKSKDRLSNVFVSLIVGANVASIMTARECCGGNGDDEQRQRRRWRRRRRRPVALRPQRQR